MGKTGKNGSERAVPAGAAAGVKPPRLGQAFANTIAVLMRDPTFRTLSLADLEWLVLPPLIAGQFRIGYAASDPKPALSKSGSDAADGAATRTAGAMVPVAVALWARVSPKVDELLTAGADKPLRLQSPQWTSGDQTWLMVVAGERSVLPGFRKQLAAREFKDMSVKLRIQGRDGKPVVKLLSELVAV